MSFVTFLAYGWDKFKAQRDGWRTPEKTLHMLAALGGWPGAIAGQRYFRHKTQKQRFLLVTYSIATLHVIAVCCFLAGILGP